MKTTKNKKSRKPATEKQKKALAKGRAIQKRAMQIMKAAGTKTIPAKQVSKITLGQAMKKASKGDFEKLG